MNKTKKQRREEGIKVIKTIGLFFVAVPIVLWVLAWVIL